MRSEEIPPGFLQSCYLLCSCHQPLPHQQSWDVRGAGSLAKLSASRKQPSGLCQVRCIKLTTTAFCTCDPVQRCSVREILSIYFPWQPQWDLIWMRLLKGDQREEGLTIMLSAVSITTAVPWWSLELWFSAWVELTKNPYRVPISNTPHDPSKWSCGERCGYCGHCDFARKSFCSGWFVMR